MEPYFICHLLKKYGFKDISKIAFERLKISEVPTRICYDGSEAPISYEELLDGASSNIFGFLSIFLSFAEKCGFNKKGSIGTENVILNKEVFFSSIQELKNGILEYSEFNENIESVCSRNIFLILRAIKYGVNDYLPFSVSMRKQLFNVFGKLFSPTFSVYTHQHIEDSEFGTGGEPASIYVIKMDRSGNVLISGGDDGIIRLWNAHTGNQLTSIRKHPGDIIDLDINSCNALLASCCGKGQMFLTFVNGNEWAPLSIIENTDRLTYVRFAYSKHSFNTNKYEIFHESELLLTASDSAIISIYKVLDLFTHGISHYYSIMKQKDISKGSFENFHKLFKYYNNLYSSNSFDCEKSIYYRSPPLYKVDIFPLFPKAFDICLNPLENSGFSSEKTLEKKILFSVGASLQSSSSSEEIQIKIIGKNSFNETFTIQKQLDKKGYSLIFTITLEKDESFGISFIDMPQQHNDHPDVSFANNSHDIVTASDDGTVILWALSRNNIYSQKNLITYVSDKIKADAYSKKKVSTRKTVTQKPLEYSVSDDSDYIVSASMDENPLLRRNPVRSSRFSVKESSFNENNKSTASDGSPNVVQFIDSIQWSCDDSSIIIAQSVTSKGSLKRQRNMTLVHCIESCISYFSRFNGERILDVILPDTFSRIACLVPHPVSPEIVLSLTYSGHIFVISNYNSQKIQENKATSNILFKHKNAKNPYLNAIWLKDGLGFVVSQKCGSFEIFRICNCNELNNQLLTQSYRFSLPEQFFLKDFSEIIRDNNLGLIDPNVRKPIFLISKSITVDKNKRMYPETVQPPVPMSSSFGYGSLTGLIDQDLLNSRTPLFTEMIDNGTLIKEKNPASIRYIENAKRRMRLNNNSRKLNYNASIVNNPLAGGAVTSTQPQNMSDVVAEEFSLNPIANQYEHLSNNEEVQSISSESSYDEDFEINEVDSNYRRDRLNHQNAISTVGSSSLEESSSDDHVCDSDLTSEDSLYDEIRDLNNVLRTRRETLKKKTGEELPEIESIQNLEFRYYAISNLGICWAPDSEYNHNDITCKLCNKNTTTVIGYKYQMKSGIEFNTQLSRPVLHGVNGSIDLGPLMGPFDYRLSTQRPERSTRAIREGDGLKNEKHYFHSRCLITIPFLHWETINGQIYTNLFDIIRRIYNPSPETPPLPKNGLTSTFFDLNIVKFPRIIKTCSYCQKFGASILCQGNKCNRQFHYHCSSLIYHSFPEAIGSSYISPRESNLYWCDIMQFYLFYCPKCIQLRQSNVPYSPRRENMICNGNSAKFNRSWLLIDQVSAGYTPQINDYLYFFPNAHKSSGLDDLLFKNILMEVDNDQNKRTLRRNSKKLEFIKCKLVHISYAFPNNSEHFITAILTFSTETISGFVFHWQIRCFPNEGPDYLVLEDDVEKGIHNLEHRFRIGQENVIYVDNQWHEIIIRNIKHNVIWESIEVSWKQDDNDINDTLMVSPWEIYEFGTDFKTSTRNLEGADEIIKIFSWILSQTGLNNPLSIVKFFKYPIPFYSRKNNSTREHSNEEWVMYYWKEIPLPFSLILIVNRIRNNYYRRVESLIFDILLVRSNCEHFNINNSILIQGVRTIEYELLRLIFNKRLPRYILQTNTDISNFDPNYGEILNAQHSLGESDQEIINNPGKRARRIL
ncbi:WD domain, G-beta repeat-containing protein [Cryptosporidium felis]|nr:WD domain, G-beta repeat-containing protein [Cryptosporidium felis]